jgi:hypothetical protein
LAQNQTRFASKIKGYWTQMSNDRLTVEIGGLTFAIEVENPLTTAPIAALYQAFKVSDEAEWHVRVILDTTLHDQMPPQISHHGQVTYFRTMSHQGWVDLDNKRAEVSSPSPQRIHSAMVRVISFIAMQVLPRRGEGLLVHGAGIIIEQRAHLFFGASGRGKSTVARLAQGIGRVLTDENVIIRKSEAGFRLYSTPFWGLSTPTHEIQSIGRADAPLVGLYALEHSVNFELERLSKGRATMALLTSEKVATERNSSAAAWLDMVSEVVEQVPTYRLGFRPTSELWHFLAEQGCLSSGTLLGL